MNPRTLISCGFAAYGMFTAISALAELGWAFSMIAALPRDETYPMMIAQYAQAGIPVVVGLFIVAFSKLLASVVVKAAGIPEEVSVLRVDERAALRFLFITVGLVLSVRCVHSLVSAVYLFKVSRTGSSQEILFASERLPHVAQLSGTIAELALGLLLIGLSKRLASFFGTTNGNSKSERGEPGATDNPDSAGFQAEKSSSN